MLYEDWAAPETNEWPLPILTLRPRGFAVLQSVPFRNLGSVSVCFLPFGPFHPWALGSSAPKGAGPAWAKRHSSRALTRHLGVFISSVPPAYSRPASTAVRFGKAPRWSFPALQHFRTMVPLFAPPLSRRRPGSFALLPGGHVLGFGYPHDVSSSPVTLGGLFQPPTLMGFALQSLFSSRVIEVEFPLLFPLLRFPTKPYGLASALQRLAPTREAVPLIASRRISPGRGRMLSWAFGPLGLSLRSPRPEGISTPGSPLPPLDPGRLATTEAPGHRVSLRAARLSPPEGGAGPSGLSHRPSSPTL